MSKKVVIIQFSSRQKGNCNAISKVISEFYQEDNVRAYTVDACNMPACSNCDYECLTPGKTCPNLMQEQIQLYADVCNADITYMIVPNYCGYPCANYFAYNERSVGYFNLDRALMDKYMSAKKRFIVVSNTEGANFENALAQQSTEPKILYLKTGRYGKRSTAGDLMDSEDAKDDLIAFLSLEDSV